MTKDQGPRNEDQGLRTENQEGNLLLGQEEDLLLGQEEDLLLGQQEDLLLDQEDDLLLGQEYVIVHREGDILLCLRSWVLGLQSYIYEGGS